MSNNSEHSHLHVTSQRPHISMHDTSACHQRNQHPCIALDHNVLENHVELSIHRHHRSASRMIEIANNVLSSVTSSDQRTLLSFDVCSCRQTAMQCIVMVHHQVYLRTVHDCIRHRMHEVQARSCRHTSCDVKEHEAAA